MIELIFARHGQTDWNLEGKLQGVLDIPLNQTGLNEATTLKESFDFDVKYIISSPLKRALKTAEIINEKLGLNIELDSRLAERDFGSLAGGKACFVKTMENSGQADGETIETFENKLLDFLESCKDLDDGAYLVTTHGGVIITLLTLLSERKLTWDNTPIKNCTVTSLIFNKNWSINYYNKHITELSTVHS